jgi:hypothetical protein
MVASIELSTMPIEVVSCSRKDSCRSVNGAERGELDHRLDLALEQHRQHDDVRGCALNRPERIGTTLSRHLGDEHAPRVARALADQALRRAAALGVALDGLSA